MPSRPPSLSQLIKAEAQRLGFSLVGAALPEPPPHFAVFTRWLAQGRQAGMGYLASERSLERRADPTRILPEARSVVVVGIPYAPPVPGEVQSGRGRVAAYAWGADYHAVIPARLEALVHSIAAITGGEARRKIYTDTGPILERDFAQQAGLGWIGKNTCLISPRLGSYFLLGEILTDLELEPDPPTTHDYCGSCRRCIDACPTGCILPDRTLDAGRCISYLTIENKGAIPLELRPSMGNWVFGCDICQAACPWNLRFGGAAGDTELAPREGTPAPQLSAEIQLTAREFNHRYRGSPIERPRRRGYLRNVAVAMGNTGDPALAPDLARALREDPEALVRGHAAWALGQVGGGFARTALDQALQAEPDAWVVEEIRTALEQ